MAWFAHLDGRCQRFILVKSKLPTTNCALTYLFLKFNSGCHLSRSTGGPFKVKLSSLSLGRCTKFVHVYNIILEELLGEPSRAAVARNHDTLSLCLSIYTCHVHVRICHVIHSARHHVFVSHYASHHMDYPNNSISSRCPLLTRYPGTSTVFSQLKFRPWAAKLSQTCTD